MDKQLAKGKGVADRQYEDLLAKILDSGNEKADRWNWHPLTFRSPAAL
ncbi:MAG: hypothetical protein ACLS7Q_09480 [Varibaculum cambriense]